MAKCELIWLVNSQALNPGHLASRGGCVRDAGQRGSNPGRPGQSGTGGNPTKMTPVKPQISKFQADKILPSGL